MSLAAGGAVALAAALDRTFAEPPIRAHPVAWLGRAAAALDSRLPDSRAAGVALTATLPAGFAAALAAPVLAVAAPFYPQSGMMGAGIAGVLAGVALFSCTSHRMLVTEATAVISLSTADPAAARTRLRSLAGRDAEALRPEQVRSAAVESAAENLADGLIAPYLAFAAGVVLAGMLDAPIHVALAGGVAGAGFIKGINTLDSMLGYRHRAAGWAPARTDDLLMWVPARVAAVAIVIANGPRTAAAVVSRARASAGTPTSPNSGWPMATVASAREIRLEKPNAYTLCPEHALPSEADAAEGVRLVSRAAWLAVVAIGLAVVILA